MVVGRGKQREGSWEPRGARERDINVVSIYLCWNSRAE